MSKIKQSTEIATNRYKAKPIFAEEKKFNPYLQAATLAGFMGMEQELRYVFQP